MRGVFFFSYVYMVGIGCCMGLRLLLVPSHPIPGDFSHSDESRGVS